MLGIAGKKKTARTTFRPKKRRLSSTASGIASTVTITVVPIAYSSVNPSPASMDGSLKIFR